MREHASEFCYMQLEGRGATVDAVLDAMDKHSWVHLACHAIQNREETSHSAFHLHDGCLTLKNISKRSFKNKGLAFLSACQTATGDYKLPDESLHLAAGMLLAGYPAVIATMWSIWDADAPDLTREVYAELLKGSKIDWKEAARALHNAIAILREKVGQDSLKRWVPFIDIGI